MSSEESKQLDQSVNVAQIDTVAEKPDAHADVEMISQANLKDEPKTAPSKK